MTKLPLISIIVPAYNSEQTISRTVDSIISNANNCNYEIIIVDDGSTDKTGRICDSLSAQNPLIKTIHQPNSGPSKARNVGIAAAHGEYITLIDADDSFTDNIINALSSFLVKNGSSYDIVLFDATTSKDGVLKHSSSYPAFAFSSRQLKLLRRSIYSKFLEYNQLLRFDCFDSKLIKRSFLLEHHISAPEHIYRYEDAIFCNLLYLHEPKTFHLPILGYIYHYNPKSLCHKYNPNIQNETYNALIELKKHSPNLQDFYVKCLTTLSVCETSYYLHQEYPQNLFSSAKEFRELLERPFYHNAIKNIDPHKIPSHYRVETWLLRLRLVIPYLLCKKLYFSLRRDY